ncbi:hypothetical protein CP10139811_0675 [Chlamydia ibidis]|uniref:Uncharacterized protein n=2 Tax=Chlamydia ibidis TaxID=1405396 RepID=S7KEV2_9CHLA|nr:hypothetical protein [Chlamydia ibidis]EPP34701.1 hypothetical protein CP10139811_0675 [Chlamydia ibidis]EQM62254.1 hypothetical protein H359_1060 [Chlamydia ibidis 10-1398/6]
MSKKSKKTKKVTTQAKTDTPIVVSNFDQQEQAIQNLENFVSAIYKDLPLAETFGGINNEKQLTQMIAALSGTLDAFPIETLTRGLFSNPQEDEKFSKDLSSILHGLKNLTSVVNKHVSDRK